MNKKLIGIASSLSLSVAMLAGCTGGAATNSTEPTNTGSNSTSTTSSTARPAVTAPPIEAKGDTIKIGLVASISGALKPWGDDSARGAKLAVDEFNAMNKLGGKKVELIVEDSGSDPKQGQSVTDRLIASGVIGIVGEVASGITAQIAESAFRSGVPVVAVGATKTTLTDVGNNIFRVCYTDALQGPVMARFAYEELGLRNMAVMTDNQQPYSQGLSASFSEKFKALGGKIIREEFYKSGDTQFTSQITNLKGLNPDGIFCSGYFTEVGIIAREVGQQGLKVKLLGGDGWDSSELQNSGEAILGGYFCNHYNSAEDRPEVAQFLSSWKKAYDGSTPGTTMGALGYDAAMLMCDALTRAEKMDTHSLIKAIDETVGFKGVSGVIDLKGHNGNPPKRALVVELQKSGQVFAKAYEPEEN